MQTNQTPESLANEIKRQAAYLIAADKDLTGLNAAINRLRDMAVSGVAVVNAAREAMDESFEAGNDAMDISIPSLLAAALSLRLDEHDAATKRGEA